MRNHIESDIELRLRPCCLLSLTDTTEPPPAMPALSQPLSEIPRPLCLVVPISNPSSMKGLEVATRQGAWMYPRERFLVCWTQVAARSSWGTEFPVGTGKLLVQKERALNMTF